MKRDLKDEQKEIKSHFEEAKKIVDSFLLNSSEKILHIRGDYGVGKTILVKEIAKNKGKTLIIDQDLNDKDLIQNIHKIIRLPFIKEINIFTLKRMKLYLKLKNWFFASFFIILVAIIAFIASINWSINWIENTPFQIATGLLICFICFAFYLLCYPMFLFFFKFFRKKIIVIENIDRLDYSNSKFLLNQLLYLSKKLKKIKFILTFEPNNSIHKNQKNIFFLYQSEKYIDNEIDLNLHFQDYKSTILKDIFDKEVENNASDFKGKRITQKFWNSINSNLTNINKFKNLRIFKKALARTFQIFKNFEITKTNPFIHFVLNIIKLENFYFFDNFIFWSKSKDSMRWNSRIYIDFIDWYEKKEQNKNNVEENKKIIFTKKEEKLLELLIRYYVYEQNLDIGEERWESNPMTKWDFTFFLQTPIEEKK